ncbi:MAG TPA: VOC family protein [Burkholderiaceae bacterium]|nr:VOC family protein [Burkholderiaceae bacterium]
MNARVDHLVIACDSLEQGIAWCVTTLGVQPAGGGKHPLMGTHNRVLSIASDRFPDCYLELIAIDPEAEAIGRARWFGLDDAALQAAARERPRLVHAVARTRMIEMLRWGLINCGLNPGEPLTAQRDTPHGVLKWRITVRDDGRTECAGALPTLIEWQGPHPCEHLARSPVALQELVLRGVPAQAHDVLKLPSVRAAPLDGGTPLSATLDTPRGRVMLDGWRPGA